IGLDSGCVLIAQTLLNRTQESSKETPQATDKDEVDKDCFLADDPRCCDAWLSPLLLALQLIVQTTTQKGRGIVPQLKTYGTEIFSSPPFSVENRGRENRQITIAAAGACWARPRRWRL